MEPNTSRFVDQVAAFFEQEGYARITGQVFGRLLLSGEAMALDDLVADLRVSKASISTDARRLLRQGILERVNRPGDRRAYYRVATDLPKRVMIQRVDRLRRFRSLLVGEAPRQSRDPQVRRRLEELARTHAKMAEAITKELEL